MCQLSYVPESEQQEPSGVSADSAPVREQDEARSVSMLLLGSSMGSAVFQRTMPLPGNSMGPVVLYQLIMTLSGNSIWPGVCQMTTKVPHREEQGSRGVKADYNLVSEE